MKKHLPLVFGMPQLKNPLPGPSFFFFFLKILTGALLLRFKQTVLKVELGRC